MDHMKGVAGGDDYQQTAVPLSSTALFSIFQLFVLNCFSFTACIFYSLCTLFS